MMATRKLRSPTTGKIVEATVVEFEEISGQPVILRLADGSVLRLKTDVIEVARFEGERDNEGHPLYNVRSGNILVILESQDSLEK